MKLIYYSVEPYGYGLIYKNTINTEEARCIRFDEKTVTISETSTDLSGGEYTFENIYFREFVDAQNKLLKTHKERIAELQNEVRFLEAATDYKDYSKRYNTPI